MGNELSYDSKLWLNMSFLAKCKHSNSKY